MHKFAIFASLFLIRKGSILAAREVLEKVDASGMPYVVNYLCGAGGHGYGLAVVPGTPLYRAMQKGLYEESTSWYVA